MEMGNGKWEMGNNYKKVAKLILRKTELIKVADLV